jgi:hypothetical protein
MKSKSVEIPLKDFIKEHKRLIKTLEHGLKSSLMKEAKDQKKELAKVKKMNK